MNNEIKAGDRINTPEGMGMVLYECGGWRTIKLDNGGWQFNIRTTIPEKENKPTDEIKCGDKVHVIRSANLTPASGIDLFRRNISLVTRIKDGIASLYIIDEYGLDHYAEAPIEDLVKVFKDESDKDKPHDNTITIPVKADLDDTYWDAYKAELAKEIAVKLADNNTITIPKICDHITDFATRIVDNLKKQSE